MQQNLEQKTFYLGISVNVIGNVDFIQKNLVLVNNDTIFIPKFFTIGPSDNDYS